MTHRDHLKKILSGDTSDWVPNYELGCWGQTVERWLQEGMPITDSRVGAMDMFEGEDLFRLDRRAFARLHTGMIPDFGYQVLEEDERYVVARHGNGVVTRALKEGTVRGTRMSMDSYIQFPVTDEKSWEDVKRRYDPSVPVRYPFWWDEQARLWKDCDYPVVLLGNASFGLYSHLRWWAGTEGISYLFYDNPKLVQDMLEFATDFFLQLVERAITEVQFDYFNFFEDCAGKGGPLFGPALFKKFFERPYRRIIERLNRAGIQSIWLDSDGNCEALIPCWMDVGVNCHWPLEQASGMDPVRLRKKYGKDLALAGGIDKMEVAKGPKAIREELERKIPALLDQGGYIPFLDHAIPPDISYQDFLYYMDLKMKLIGRSNV